MSGPLAGLRVQCRRLAIDVKEIDHHVPAELVPNFLTVDVGLTLLGAAVGGDDEIGQGRTRISRGRFM